MRWSRTAAAPSLDGTSHGWTSTQHVYARIRAVQRRLTGKSAQECILHGKACRPD